MQKYTNYSQMVTKFLRIPSGRAVRTHGNHLKNTAGTVKLERSDGSRWAAVYRACRGRYNHSRLSRIINEKGA